MIDVFVIDPPWEQTKGGLRKVREKQGRIFDYKTMDFNKIFELLDCEIFSQASENHCVFMWVIDKFLVDCDLQMSKRGYKRHCRFVWDKGNGIAPAFTIRYAHEYLIWYYKEKLLPISKNVRGKFTSIFFEKRREHSRKPDCSYRMINAFYPSAVKLDVFSREARPNWLQYGDQKNYFTKDTYNHSNDKLSKYQL